MQILHYRNAFFIVQFILLSVIFSCNNKEQIEISIQTDSPKDYNFRIENKSNTTASFQIIINNLDFTSNKKIVYHIAKKCLESGKRFELCVFQFMNKYTWHEERFLDNNQAYSPYLLVNSIGGELCGGRSAVYTNIMLLAGYEARSWVLEGHVVSEVYTNNDWKVFDPSLEIFYFNNENKIASYNDLVNNPELIINPAKKKTNYKTFGFFYPYSRRLAEMYSTIEDNEIFNTDYDLSIYENLNFELPPNSSFRFPFNCEMSLSSHSYAILEIERGFTGKINIPLVIAGVKGEGLFKYNGTDYNISDFKLDDIRNNANISFEIEIINSETEILLFYLINPYIYGVKQSNNFYLKGRNLSDINISLEKREFSHNSPHQQKILYSRIHEIVLCTNKIAIVDFESLGKRVSVIIEKSETDSVLNSIIDFETLNSMLANYDFESIKNENYDYELFSIDSNITDFIIIMYKQFYDKDIKDTYCL